MNVDRLNRLADFLDTVPPESFDMDTWLRGSPRSFAKNECGTAACALGWACSIPEFRKAGLKRMKTVPYTPTYRGDFGSSAAAMFFDISWDQARQLFWGYRAAGPRQKAAQIREMIAKASP